MKNPTSPQTVQSRPSLFHVHVNPARWALKASLIGLISTAFLQSASAQNWSLGGAWYVTNTIAHLANGNNNRGLAYGAISNQVFVATRNGASSAIDVFDGTSGALLSGAGGVNGAATAVPDQIGVGDDSVLYAVQLNTALSTGSPLKLYSWTNWNTAPNLIYQSTNASDPVITSFNGKRIGDTMAVSGSGLNTLILAGVGGPSSTNLVLFHTTDGTTFIPTVITNVAGLPATPGSIYGIAFYTNGSFLVQPGINALNPVGHNVYLVSYPANFATQNAVTGTVLGSTAAYGGNQTYFMDYSPAGQMLAVAQTSSANPSPAGIFSLTNFPAGAPQLATTNFPTPNANGNATGGAILGGQGKTNFLYVLESNNGLRAYSINFTAGAVGPSITSQPSGISGAYPPQTLTVTANGSAPLFYQWYVVSGGTTNPVVGANTNAYTINGPVNNNYFVVITNAALSANSVTSSVVTVSLLTPVTNSVVNMLWSVGSGAAGYSYLGTGDTTRGITYDTNLNRVIVAAQTGGPGLYLLDGNLGSNLGTLSTAGMYAGGVNGWLVDQVGAADDGAVYAGNLAVSAGTFALTRWPAATNGAAGTTAYSANDPGSGSGDRWGDNMAVRGAGTATQILVPSKGTNVALFTTFDGLNFSPNLIAITNAPAGFAGNGVAFGTGNSFWAKKYVSSGGGGDLYLIAFDPVGLKGGVVFDYTSPGQIPAPITGVGVDPVHNIFAGVNDNDNHHDLQFFQLTGDATPPVLFHQAFFQSAILNGNNNAAVVLKYPRAYALDVNNGIVALTYGVPATTPVTINAAPTGGTVYTNDPAFTFSVGVSGSLPIYYTWQYNTVSNLATAHNILNATNQTFVLNYPPVATSGWYNVIAKNIGGMATSAPVQLSVITPLSSPVVTQTWSLAAGSRPYLDSSSYNTRGLSYDTNTGTLLVADHNTIYLLAGTNGSDLGTLNMAGLGTAGLNGWVVDQLGVADDGVLYSCNLSLTGPGFFIARWPSLTPGSAANNYAWGTDGTGADPSGTGERWGDTMSVRGAGTGTQILIGSPTSTNVVFFTTADGQTFTTNVIAIAGVPPGFAGQGIAFGSNNTFWAKSPGYNLRQIAFNPSTSTGTAVQSFSAGTQVNSSMDGIDVDIARDIVGGVVYSDVPHDLQLLLLSGNANPPSFFDQVFFASANINSQFNAATALKNGRGFSLDVNNGIVSFNYSVPAAPAVTITSVTYQAGIGATLVLNNCFNGHTYQIQFRSSLTSGSWGNVGSVVASGPTASFLDTTATGITGFYRVLSN
ncbi:MAG: hypothetical protein QOJ40_1015 [Verrucomicrobiota bacterium]